MSRATSPVLGVIGMVAVTVVAAAVLGAGLQPDLSGPPPVADLDLSVDAADDRVAIHHAGGDALAVEDLRVRIRVDGVALAHQPPVPYFAARGFVGGPTGPFNSAHEGTWRAGETAAVRIASTNAPRIEPGDDVVVTVATDDAVLAELEARAT